MRVINKKANFEYLLTGEHFEAGIVLLGAEAKSLRNSRADLKQSVVRAIDNELYLINCNIPVVSPPRGYTPTRSRKLLLNKKEIVSAITKSKQLKLTFVPVSLYNKGRLFKLEFALGKPKRKFEKKESIKKKDVERDIERELKGL
ncbi:MAG: SsrA-binding protein [Parcubacteria group bacterium GW2011_GWA1_38_7]|nr:MAG: SsrA-binding protein [Parcubacteria group bacterium GW2011_GWA1_38_7]